jgi:hypothetical protein
MDEIWWKTYAGLKCLTTLLHPTSYFEAAADFVWAFSALFFNSSCRFAPEQDTAFPPLTLSMCPGEQQCKPCDAGAVKAGLFDMTRSNELAMLNARL